MRPLSRASLLATVLACGTSILAQAGTAEPPGAEPRAGIEKLEKPITVKIIELPLARGVELIATRAGLGLEWADPAGAAADSRTLSLNLAGVRAVDVLDALGHSHNLRYEIKAGKLRASLAAAVVLKEYVLSDLLHLPPEEMTQHEPQEKPIPLGTLDWLFRTVNNGGGLGGSIFTPPSPPQLTPDNLADMIRNRVRPELWDPALGTSIEVRGGLLLITQTEDLHAEVRELLAEFRAKNHRQVSIETRVLDVRSIDLDRIRREAAGRGTPEESLDAPALAALEALLQNGEARQILSTHVLAFNQAETKFADLKFEDVVSRYELGEDTVHPVITSVPDGTYFRVKPALSDDGASALLTLKLSCVEPAGPPERMSVPQGRPNEAKITDEPKEPAKPRVPEVPTEPKKPNEAGAPTPPPLLIPPVPPPVPPSLLPPSPRPPTDITQVIRDFPGPEAAQTPVLPTPPKPSPYPDLPGALQLKLPKIAVQRFHQQFVLREGQYGAASAPLSRKDGMVPGREALLLVRYQLTRPAPARQARARPEIPPAFKAALARPVSIVLAEVPFKRMLQDFASEMSIPVMLDEQALGAKLGNPVSLDMKVGTGQQALKEILRAVEAEVLAYPSLLLVTSRHRPEVSPYSLRIYDIRDMLGTECLWPAPYTGDPFAQPVPRVLQAFDIAAMIKEKLFAAEFAETSASLEEFAGKLIVVQTEAVHAKIVEALERFRRTAQRRVAVTSRWAVVDMAGLKAQLGDDIPAVLDAAQAEKVVGLIARAPSRDLAATRAVAFDEQQVGSLGAVGRSMVKDYKTNDGVVFAPVVESVYEGVFVNVTPHLGRDGPLPVSPLHLDVHLRMTRLVATPKFDLAVVAPASAPVVGPASVPVGTAPKAAPASVVAPASAPVAPAVHTPSGQNQEVLTQIQIPDGGAALFRLPPPRWLEGEDPQAAAKGQRVLIVLVQARSQK